MQGALLPAPHARTGHNIIDISSILTQAARLGNRNAGRLCCPIASDRDGAMAPSSYLKGLGAAPERLPGWEYLKRLPDERED